MITKQISVFVENSKGRLAEITDVIAKNNINICALSIADTTNFGILRIIVSDPDLCQKVLTDAGFRVSITSVITLKITDRPGELAKALALLAEHEIAVEYIYAYITKEDSDAYIVLRIEKDVEAVELLKANGYQCVKS